jgi:signal transduction histidine kinase
MAHSLIANRLKEIVAPIDPRRSLVAGAMGLIIALTMTFSIVAAVWVGGIARENVLEQHVRRLSLETDQLSSDLGQTLASHLGAVRSAGAILSAAELPGRPHGLSEVFDELTDAYPQLDWIAIADTAGVVVKATDHWRIGNRVNTSSWFAGGSQGAWIGVIGNTGNSTKESSILPSPVPTSLGDIAIPVRGEEGRVLGVIAAHLSWQRTPNHPQRLTDEIDPRGTTQAYVLNRTGMVLIGPDDVRGKHWNGLPIEETILSATAPASLQGNANGPQFERLPNGRIVLVARESLSVGSELAPLGLQVQLSEPNERVYQRADALAARILWVSLCLGVATALIGALAVRHLTHRLKRLTLSVASIGRTDAARIEVPRGHDEVAQLGTAFAKLIDDLEQERSELKTLSSELERRVAVRTREVERLAEESRYAAVVRERLKMARDLHDTLAHSIMALLSEIRFIRRLQTHDPASVPGELARAEELAHEGLNEARSAITQMRLNAVRETGLGPALSNVFERFIDHTGLTGKFRADTEAARFGDDRAETLLRMANEVLRNVERHAMATRVNVTLQATNGAHLELRIEDNGIGFDVNAVRADHFGLVGLREQADLICADLRIDSRANEGTSVYVTLPLSPMDLGQNK